MTNITLRDYYNRVDFILREKPFLRRGQAMMIVLGDVRPKLYTMLTGTNWDPFYRNDRIRDFESQIKMMWDHVGDSSNYNDGCDDDGDDGDDGDDEITINLNLSWPFL